MRKLILFLILLVIAFSSLAYAADVDPKINEELQSKDSVKVLVKLKDSNAKEKLLSLSEDNPLREKRRMKIKEILKERRDSIKSKQERVISRVKSSGKGFKEGYRYSTVNGFSAKVDSNALENLKNDPDVESIQFDYPVSIMLDVSVPLVNATSTWGLLPNGTNLTGAGETICVIDTGIDYTHTALGGCSITRITLNGTIENITAIESPHPYKNSTTYNWTITQAGYTNIAVHFKNMSIESNYDTLKIYDQNWKEIGSFTGTHNDMWSPHGEGDTLYIVWETDTSVTDYGIYIDQVINGTTNTTYDWSNCTKVLGGWDYVNSDGDPYDDHSHGTHCAGIAASEDNTYRGVAPDANLIAIKVLDSSGSGTDSDVAAGVDWCINRSADYNISVISMSLGCNGGGCTHWQSACDGNAEVYYSAAQINAANSFGIFVAIAAGNSGWTDGISSPACVSGAVPVGAVTDGDSITYNRGTLLNLLASGVSIHSTMPGGGFADKSGTSMATPHVAGAAALLQQFSRLQNGTALTPAQIENLLNLTGKSIYDSGSGRYYSRIDVYSAITSQDTIEPVVSFIAPTQDNNTQTQNISTMINASVIDNLATGSCSLEWNNTNESMTKLGSVNSSYCYINKTITRTGTFYYKIYVTDAGGNLNSTELRQIIIINTLPEVQNITLDSTDSLNLTNGTLYANWTFYDINNNSHIDNETKWYNNSAEVAALENLTEVAPDNTTKNDVWMFSVRAYDGLNWSNWANSSNLTIYNGVPVLQQIANLTVNETELINITANASDIDNDTLTYAANDTRLLQSGNSFTWQTNLSDAGIYSIRINVTDGSDSDYKEFTITILDSVDFDNDGNPDFNDTDDDNDGLDDSVDYLTGNVSKINTTSVLRLFVNNTENVTQIFNNSYTVNVTDEDNNTLVTFLWNFSASTLAVNWTIDYNASAGTIRIKNVDLSSSSITKTVYINKSSSSNNYVCIADDEITPVSSLPSDCSGYTQVVCTGSSGAYTCTDLTDKFKVEGLSHSAVKGIYIAPSPSGGGGGGGGGGGSCTESWQCTEWSICTILGEQTRTCTDLKNCGTTKTKPDETQPCVVKTAIGTTAVEEVKEEPVAEETVEEVPPEEPVEVVEEPEKGNLKMFFKENTAIIALILTVFIVVGLIFALEAYQKRK